MAVCRRELYKGYLQRSEHNSIPIHPFFLIFHSLATRRIEEEEQKNRTGQTLTLLIDAYFRAPASSWVDCNMIVLPKAPQCRLLKENQGKNNFKPGPKRT